MQTFYFLSPDSYICLGPRYSVILDARSDQYTAIARQTLESLAPWLAGWANEPPRAPDDAVPPELAPIADDLVRRGILTTSSHRGKPVCAQNIPKPLESAITTRDTARLQSQPMLRLSTTIIWSALWAHKRLSKYSLISNIQAIRDYRTSRYDGSSDGDPLRAIAFVAAFNRLLPLFSRPNACLFESFALLHFLARLKIFPSLVFGVTPEPFRAHCWLQYRALVVNDTVARVSQFTPIMLI